MTGVASAPALSSHDKPRLGFIYLLFGPNTRTPLYLVQRYSHNNTYLCAMRGQKKTKLYSFVSLFLVFLFSVFPVVNWCDPSDHVTPGAHSPCDHWGLELHCGSLGNKGQCMSSILPRRTNKTSNRTTPPLPHFFLSHTCTLKYVLVSWGNVGLRTGLGSEKISARRWSLWLHYSASL